jgi:hypothetical protein
MTMTISSVSASPYATLPTSQSISTNSGLGSAADSASIGGQLLAALAQSQAASSASSNPLLQELVSLSPAAFGQTSTAPQTYNAQGLLQQIQSNMLLNDPLLQPDATDPNGTVNNSLFQSLMSSPQIPTMAANAVGALNAAGTTQVPINAGSAAVNMQSPVPATVAGATDPNVNWAQLLKQDPSFASVLVQSEMEQGVLSMLG